MDLWIQEKQSKISIKLDFKPKIGMGFFFGMVEVTFKIAFQNDARLSHDIGKPIQLQSPIVIRLL